MERTNTESEDSKSTFSRSNLVFANVIILVVFLLIVAGVYLWVVKKNKGQIVFPAGINYLSPKTETAPASGTPLYDYKKLSESSDWTTYKGKIYPFSFQHPKELTPLVFINDPNDAVTFKLSDIAPQLNLMLSIETISDRDKNLVGKPEEFVKNYWKFFSGLGGLNSIEELTNEKGIKGFKATYIIKGTKAATTENYFFVLSDDKNHMIRIANIFPPEGQTLFKRLLNSLDYEAK